MAKKSQVMQAKYRKMRRWGMPFAGAFLILFYLFFFGPLFPWNPIKYAYQRIETPYALIYVQGEESPFTLRDELTKIFSETEDRFGLEYSEKITIILSAEDQLKGYLPWIDWDRVGGVALHTGNIVYINQDHMSRSSFDVTAFLKHEITHILFYQQMSFANAWEMKEQQWLMEGTAVYHAGYEYLSKEALPREFARRGYLVAEEGQWIYQNLDENDGRFNYALYGYFMDYLIEEYGLEKLQNYIRQYLAAPQDHRQLFQAEYGIALSQALDDLEAEIITP